MVELTEALVEPGDRVLDVGTGSGVLAVVAARCGAASVVGIDIDPSSPAAAGANAAANAVADTVTATSTPLAELAALVHHGAAPADVVLANLLASTITDLAEPLVTVTRPGGHLLLSGLLEDRWQAAVRAVSSAGPRSSAPSVREVRTEDGWAAVVLRRGPSR
jgi:ribosomal protein L11 methyltransferase